jgi:hypothetical protein
MTKGIDRFVSENRQSVKRIDSTFVPVSGQSNQNLSFTNSEIDVSIQIRVYTRSLNDSLISGHPDNNHGSGRGISGDKRSEWTLVEDNETSQDFLTSGRNLLRNALTASSTAFIRETAVGSGGGSVTPDENSLEAENGSAFAWGKDGGNNNQTVSESVFLFSEYGEEVSEYAVYSSSDEIYNRVVTNTITPTNEQEIRVETIFTIEGSGIGNSVITDTGEGIVADSLKDANTTASLSGIGFGSGDSSPQESDTSLDAFEFGVNAERVRSPETAVAHGVVFQDEPSTQPVTIREISVVDADENLIWRAVIDNFEKNDDFQFEAAIGFRIT